MLPTFLLPPVYHIFNCICVPPSWNLYLKPPNDSRFHDSLQYMELWSQLFLSSLSGEADNFVVENITSLLERLMVEVEIYSRKEQYDPRCITKLVRNFRSHPALLEVLGRLFYHGELVLYAVLEGQGRCLGGTYQGIPRDWRNVR